MSTSRRTHLVSLVSLAVWASSAGEASADAPADVDDASPDFDVKDIVVDGDRALGRRFTMLIP